MTVALNHKQIKSHPERISNVKPFIDQYNWEEINFPSHKEDWKKFRLNNKLLYNTKENIHAYKSKCIKHKIKVILLMITDGKKWHYLAVKTFSGLLRGITSKHEEDLYYLNCFHSFRTENKLKKHKNVYEDHDYCYVEMPKDDNKILKYNHGEKFMKVPFIIYADLESLLEKMNTCHNNPKQSSTTKIDKHTTSG